MQGQVKFWTTRWVTSLTSYIWSLGAGGVSDERGSPLQQHGVPGSRGSYWDCSTGVTRSPGTTGEESEAEESERESEIIHHQHHHETLLNPYIFQTYLQNQNDRISVQCSQFPAQPVWEHCQLPSDNPAGSDYDLDRVRWTMSWKSVSGSTLQRLSQHPTPGSEWSV